MKGLAEMRECVVHADGNCFDWVELTIEDAKLVLDEFDQRWLPIETAPKDGTWILGWGVAGLTYAAWERKGWWDGRTDQCGDLCFAEDVTHWMPAPAGPADKPL